MTAGDLDRQALTVIVRGRVQGVGFRAFVAKEARALGLSGVARNQADGSVEVQAEGAKASLELLLIRIRVGPAASRVETLDLRWHSTSGFEGFRTG